MKISSRGDKKRKSGQICARDQLDNVWEIVWLEQTRGGGEKPENNKLYTRLMLHFLSNRRKKWIRKKKILYITCRHD